jgi:hypothetical protein
VLLEQLVALLSNDESFFRSSWPLIFAALTRAHADEQQFQKAVALLNAESAESLSAWYRVSSFVDNPDLTAKTLRLVSASIEKIPEDVRTEYVLSVIEATSAVLFKRGDKDEVIQEFENVILAFGSHADGGHSTIYKSICDSFRDKEKKDFSRRLKLFIGIVKLGLGGGSDALNDVFGDEEMRIARRLLLDAKKQRKGNAILQAVRYEAKLSEWNSKARRLIREIIPVPRKTRWWLWISIAFLLLLVTAIGLAWWLGGIEYVIDQIRNPAKK